MRLDPYEQSLLRGWEDVYKKGQLTFWILLALKDGPKHMAEIKQFIAEQTHDTLVADDKSMYRALRRYRSAEMIVFKSAPGNGGPERKIFALASAGSRVLAAFCERNIIPVFYQSNIEKLIKRSHHE